MSKKNTETTTKEVETVEVEIENNEADEVEFESVTKKPSKFKQAGLWLKDHAAQLAIDGITVMGAAAIGAGAVIITAMVLNSKVNHTENESDDHHALEDDYYDAETDTCVEVDATENETSEE